MFNQELIQNGMKNNSLVLIVGQFFMLAGFSTFLINYFVLNNNLVLVFVIIVLFVVSMIFNLTYLIRKIKENK